MMKFLSELGAMRIVLLLFTLFVLALAPFTDMEPEGFGILTAYIAPTIALILLFVLLLDTIMNRVFMIEQDADTQAIVRKRMRAGLIAVFLLVVVWGPYFYRLVALYTEN